MSACTYVVAFLTVGVGTVAMAVGTTPSKPEGNMETFDPTVKTHYCSTEKVIIQTVHHYQLPFQKTDLQYVLTNKVSLCNEGC